MSEYEYFEPPVVNRVAVTVKFKQPYVDWANNLPDNDGMITSLEELNKNPNTYLLPSYETSDSVTRFGTTRLRV